MAMSDRVRELLAQMSSLEEELRDALHEQEDRLRYQIKGRRIEFEQTAREAHRRLKTGFFTWLVTNRPFNLLTGPIIYSMIVPLLMLDLCVSLYQQLCFPVYRVERVRRSDYFSYDRRHLAYLNFIERLHCEYCTYANGLLAYATEIVARTEQYFCPIKHARKRLGQHSRYRSFLAYGDAEDYSGRLEEYRRALEKRRRKP